MAQLLLSKNMLSLLDLPVELVEQIISVLAEEKPPSARFLHEEPSESILRLDRRPLKELSQACHSTRELCFPSLFSAVKVDLDCIGDFMKFSKRHCLSNYADSVLLYIDPTTFAEKIEHISGHYLWLPMIRVIDSVMPSVMTLVLPPSLFAHILPYQPHLESQWAFTISYQVLQLQITRDLAHFANGKVESRYLGGARAKHWLPTLPEANAPYSQESQDTLALEDLAPPRDSSICPFPITSSYVAFQDGSLPKYLPPDKNPQEVLTRAAASSCQNPEETEVSQKLAPSKYQQSDSPSASAPTYHTPKHDIDSLNVFRLRPWTRCIFNQGSSVTGYGSYEYFYKQAPSFLYPLRHYEFLRSSFDNPFDTITSFDYIAVFPIDHFKQFCVNMSFMTNLKCLRVQLAPTSSNDILDNPSALGKSQPKDLWQELESCYKTIARTVRVLCDRGEMSIETFCSLDYINPGLCELIDRTAGRKLRTWKSDPRGGRWTRKQKPDSAPR